MKSSMKLKRHLPKAPFPPTKAAENHHCYVNHAGVLTYYGKSSLDNVSSIGQAVTEQSKRNSHAFQISRKEKRWNIIREMLREGATLQEMAEETGYTTESVRTAVYKMRAAGEDLPDFKREKKWKD